MKERSRVQPAQTIGIDLGDKWSHLYVLDSDGVEIEHGRIQTTEAALTQRLQGLERCRVVIEVGTHSPWVSRLIEGLGHEVITSNAQEVRLISGSSR
jgi:transposase